MKGANDMALLDIFMNVILIFMALSLFNLIRYMFKVRKVMKMHKDNPNIKGFTIVNGEIKPIEGKPSDPTEIIQNAIPPIPGKEHIGQVEAPVVDLVVDPTCGKELAKTEAFRLLKNGKEYFFCCWECREAFLAQFNQTEAKTLV